MLCTRVPGSKNPDHTSPDRGNCVVVLGRHSASLQPKLLMGTGELLDKQTVCCDGLASRPGGSSNSPGRFMLQKLEMSAES